MTLPNPMPSVEVTSDADLVAACLAGDQQAFGRIVERYQRLLCSLAYSATGQLSMSEDLAQEAFVEAWRQLRNLREPEKLRPWLCGILRHKVGRLRRSDGKEPVRRADSPRRRLPHRRNAMNGYSKKQQGNGFPLLLLPIIDHKKTRPFGRASSNLVKTG